MCDLKCHSYSLSTIFTQSSAVVRLCTVQEYIFLKLENQFCAVISRIYYPGSAPKSSSQNAGKNYGARIFFSTIIRALHSLRLFDEEFEYLLRLTRILQNCTNLELMKHCHEDIDP